MSKNTKLFTLSAIAVFTMGLTSCNEYYQKDNFVVSFNGTDGEAISVTADDILERYEHTLTGVKAYYNAVYDVVLRYEMNQSDRAAKKKNLVDLATTKVNDKKTLAQTNADTNKTSYDTELDTILKGEGVEDLDELQAKYETANFKEYLEDDFYDTNMESLLTGTSLKVGDKEVELASYLNDVLPYHVRHILVKTSATSGDYARSTITSQEAKNLASVATRLATLADSFGEVAKSSSEDDGSKANYGDLGIMSKNTSFVNEFKLGIYTYDSIFNTSLEAEQKAKLELTTSEELKEELGSLTKLGLAKIPYKAITQLKELSEKEKDDKGELVNEGTAAYYPRNIIWNTFFNKHNVAVITPEEFDLASGVSSPIANLSDLGGFKEVPELGGQKVLTDEKGNPILVVRAGTSDYQGVHFIVVERSALVDKTTGANASTLEEYYSTLLPGDKDFPKNSDGTEKVVYVNYLVDNKQTYLTRSNSLKDEIKAADKSISEKIYQYFFTKSGATIKNAEMNKLVSQYITSTIEGNKIDTDNSYYKNWKEYTMMLERQDDERSQRLINTVCAAKFNDSNSDEFKVGGLCYYVK